MSDINNFHPDFIALQIMNRCLLRCPSCPEGRNNQYKFITGEKNSLEFISLDDCDKILENSEGVKYQSFI